VNAAEDLRAFRGDSIEGRTESLSSEDNPLSASYSDGDMLIRCSSGSVGVKSVYMVKGCERIALEAILFCIPRS